MAVPKKRHSSARRDKKRSHQALSAPNLDTCPQCGETKRPHHACAVCGTYKGREVIAIKEEFEE